MFQKSKSRTGKAVSVALAAAMLSTALMPVTAAHADHRHEYRGKHSDIRVIKRHKHRKSRDNGGDALAAGIIGLAIGAIIVDQATRYRQPDVVYVQPEPVYVPPQPVYRESLHDRRYQPQDYRSYGNDYGSDGPRVITYEDSVGITYEPWTPEWRDWCRSNYRSFNQSTGTYRGYDGRDHFCVVK